MMLLGLGFSLLVVVIGWAMLRVLRLAKGPLAIGLAPGAGLAAIAVLTSWPTLLGGHELIAALCLALAGVVGLAFAVVHRNQIFEALDNAHGQRLAFAVLIVACGIPLLVLGSTGFVHAGVPLSPPHPPH